VVHGAEKVILWGVLQELIYIKVSLVLSMKKALHVEVFFVRIGR